MKPVPIWRRGAGTLSLVAVVLSGCASTGGLHSAATRTNLSSWRAQRSLAGVPQDTAAWPKRGWWKSAGDPQLDKLVAEALADNPDMALVQARVRAALAAAGAADAKRKPTLNGGASVAGARVPPLLPPIADGHWGVLRYGYLSFKWNLDLWGGKRAAWQAAVGNRFYTASPAVSLPIFEGGALRANLAGKDAARDIAVAEYNQTLVHAINQVATQVDDLRSLSVQVQDAARARASASQAYALSMQRFRAGVGSFLEALTVRQQLITAERQLASLQLGRSNAWAELNEALGGGFRPSNDAPSLAAAQPSHPDSEATP